MHETEQDHASVHIPPPLIHGVGVAGGFGLSLWQPLPKPPGFWLPALGVALMGFALLLVVTAFREFRRHHNPVRPNQPIETIMTGGPFRLSRNPLYLSLALVHAGLALLTRNIWLVVTLLPVLLIIRYYVIAREEAYLGRRFGERYLNYRRRVRRWL